MPAGEVCLPGGKRDASDPTARHTALREAHEELGLPPHTVQPLCNLRPVLSKHFLSVTPVVARLDSSFVPCPNANEVQAVFNAPLRMFLEEEGHR